MQNENETVEETKLTAENENLDAQGTTEDLTTGSADVRESESIAEEAISKDEYEKLQKELDQIKMERNMLKNKTQEEHKARLEEEGEFKSLYEETKTELEAIRVEAERKEAESYNQSLRDKFIEEYSDSKVKEAAKALLKNNPNNLWWGSDAANEVDAKDQIFKQLDSLKETLGVITEEKQEQDDTSVHANNPSTPLDPEAAQYANMSAEEMRQALIAEGLMGESR